MIKALSLLRITVSTQAVAFLCFPGQRTASAVQSTRLGYARRQDYDFGIAVYIFVNVLWDYILGQGTYSYQPISPPQINQSRRGGRVGVSFISPSNVAES